MGEPGWDLDERTTALLPDTHVDPKAARTRVAQWWWCQTWLDGYGTRKLSTVRQARLHGTLVIAEFGAQPLAGSDHHRCGRGARSWRSRATRRSPSMPRTPG